MSGTRSSRRARTIRCCSCRTSPRRRIRRAIPSKHRNAAPCRLPCSLSRRYRESRSETAWRDSAFDEQRHQRIRAALAAPVPVQLRIKRRALREHVGGVEVLPRAEYARRAVLQPDFHLAGEDEYPLRRRRAVELAAEPDRALAQLVAARGQHRRQARLRRAFAERDAFLPPARFSVVARIQHDFREGLHVARSLLALGLFPKEVPMKLAA